MCGLAGFFTSRSDGADRLEAQVERMTTPIAHRGPDDAGTWVDPAAGIALGFRRLAIVDLSALGHQPMPSASGRYMMTFNGEVFNFAELRPELEALGHRFRGHSDTEVILAAFEEWGIERAVRRFVGMFAIAVWDRERRALTLLRDRLGIKPMFVYAGGGLVSWGSELKSLVAGPSFDATIDRAALAQFFRYLYVPAPRSIYAKVRKLAPGHMLTITDPSATPPASVPYWSVEEVARAGLADPFRGSDDEVIAEFDRLLSDSVRLRLQADVPLGALLSGGIDSSTVTAIAQELSPRPVKTFCIAFDAAEHNEAHHAAAIARHLGTDHTEVMLTGRDALDVVPRLADTFDEPHADTSQIPAFLVCQVARRDVTVALSGDGGDEVYGGYNRYTYGERMFGRVMRVPRPARRLVAAGIDVLSPDSWDRAHRAVAPMLPSGMRHRLPGDKLHKFGRLMAARSEAQMYRTLVSAWQHPEALVRDVPPADDVLERVLAGGEPRRLLDRMMLADQLTYLADDQLAKVDRVSMAVSLEARVPLLDHRLVEFSWRLPAKHKVRDGKGKWLLRQSLYKRVPRDLVERPKMGLSVPLGAWLRGPLRPWAESLLDEGRIAREGILDARAARAQWEQLLAGRDESALAVWTLLIFQSWHERWAA
jgi:asparagine synthase (glutamine-hydrolysing)